MSVNRVIEIARWAGVVLAFVLASQAGTPEARLGVLTVVLALSLAGLTAIEGLFFRAGAAQLSGYAPSAYQQQSALNNLAVCFAALLSYLLGWGAGADLAILTVLLTFFGLSGVNHLLSALRDGNRTLNSFLRPAASLLLVIAALPFLLTVACKL